MKIFILTFGQSLCRTVPSSLFNGLSFLPLKLRLATASLLSKQPANFFKSVKLQLGLSESVVPTKTRTFVPARRRLRPRGPHSSPRDCPHAGPGARAAALLAASPGAMPPSGRPTRAAAHGWVPARPGEPRQPCRLPARRKWRDFGSTSAEQLRTSRQAALAPWENLRRRHGLKAATWTRAVESAL